MTPRLKRIVELLPVSDELFDVGCDHGIVGVSALLLNKTQKRFLPTLAARVSKRRADLRKAKASLTKANFFAETDFAAGGRIPR